MPLFSRVGSQIISSMDAGMRLPRIASHKPHEVTGLGGLPPLPRERPPMKRNYHSNNKQVERSYDVYRSK